METRVTVTGHGMCKNCGKSKMVYANGLCYTCTEQLDENYFDCEKSPGDPTRTIEGGGIAYRKLLDEMWQLHVAKSLGYSGDAGDVWDNFRQCENFGIDVKDGVLTRMSDKWSRLGHLWSNAKLDKVGESIRDTLVDLASYAMVLVCLLEEDNIHTAKH